MKDEQEHIIGELTYVTAKGEDTRGAPEDTSEHPPGELSTREEVEARIMMEWFLPSFLTATRAAVEGHSQAEQLQAELLAVLENNVKEALQDKGDGRAEQAKESAALWTAAADLCRAVLMEHRSALDLVRHAEELDKHPAPAWKVLCVLCYLGGSIDPMTLPLLAVNMQMAVVEYVYHGTHRLSEVYEQVVVGWFCSYWERTFENARFRFQAPRMVGMDLKAALRSDPQVRLQRVLNAVAFGLATSLPERGREWFLEAG